MQSLDCDQNQIWPFLSLSPRFEKFLSYTNSLRSKVLPIRHHVLLPTLLLLDIGSRIILPYLNKVRIRSSGGYIESNTDTHLPLQIFP